MSRFTICALGLALGMGIVGRAAIAAPTKCPQIMIIMDRTGSMTQKLDSGDVKWDVISKAVKAFTSKYDKGIRFGFEYFNGAGCKMPVMTKPCDPGCILFPPEDNAAVDVAAAVDMLKPAGTTSTHETMEPVKDYAPLKDPTYSNFVLLITDGLPNCTETMDPAVPGGYSGAKSIAAIKAVYDTGVPVFVMGLGTKGAMGVPVTNPDILDKMADAGGVPQTVPPAPHKFYAADSPAEVDAALEAIAGRAGGGTVGGCRVGGGGGSGGSGSGGAGGGSGGASGDNGFDGGAGADRPSPGCLCGVGSRTTAAGGSLGGLLLLGLALLRRRR